MTFATTPCAPLPSGTRALDGAQLRPLRAGVAGCKLGPARAEHSRRLERRLDGNDFRAAPSFLSRGALFAEAAQDHPDFQVRSSKIDAAIWTRSIGGVVRNAFILAAKLPTIAVG